MGNYHIESLTNKGEWKPENISAELSKSIIQQAAIAGSTLFNYLMASYVTLLHIYTDQIDICVGTPYANRDKCETQKMMGYFVNTIVLRNNLDGDPTFKEILDRVQKNAIEAYRHASVPFYKVVEIIRPERQLNGNPLFQTMLVMNNAPVDNLKIGDLEIKRVEIYPSTARFDILMSFAETSKGIRLFINYKVQMFDETDIDRIFKDFNKLLKILATGNSNMKLSNIKKLMEGCVVNKPAKFTRS
ncbi:condensation domain-containing protein [Bacillus paralicheniformis]|nr:condensation domain-containing protein [Bacillus paralicheniformis]MEC1241832.1 condensation domain-containing protein [Bacillus paralicheniformis]